MKAERYLEEEATIKKGVDALVRELGPVEAMRFLVFPVNVARKVSSVIGSGKKIWIKRSFLTKFLDRFQIQH